MKTRYDTVRMLAEIDANHFAGDLRRHMEEMKLTQRALAELSGVDHSTISRLLRTNREPQLRLAIALSKGLRKRRATEWSRAPLIIRKEVPPPPKLRRIETQ